MSTENDGDLAAAAGQPGGMAAPAFEQLAEIATLVASARDAMSDEMVARLARATSEGVALLDRITRNEALMHFLRVLERPEGQHLLMGMSRAVSQMSREVATSAPASGGIGGLWGLARSPGTQEALRALSVLGQCCVESLRKPDGSRQ